MRFGAKKFYSNFALLPRVRPAAFKKKRIKIEKIKADKRILRPRGRKKRALPRGFSKIAPPHSPKNARLAAMSRSPRSRYTSKPLGSASRSRRFCSGR